jgi:enediyne biosynthesis protein E4
MGSRHTITIFKSANLFMSIKFSTVLFLFFFLASCNKKKVFKQLSPGTTGIHFENKLTYTDSLTVMDFEYMFNGAGVALCDINNDGLQDILFTGNMVPAKLYLNKGNLKFEDITEKSGIKAEGWCYGIAVVDINQDGYPDFYISKSGNKNTPASQRHNYFFINNGPSPSPNGEGRGEVTFTESAAKMGLDDDGYDVQAAFFDYDKDGDLDMYLMRNSFVNYNRNNAREMKPAMETSSTTDKLFRNDGNLPDGQAGLQFTDVSKEAGITIEGFGLGVSVCDINKDNWPDVYVSNDFITSDLVWINNHDGTFTNKAKEYLRHQTYNAMGNDVADFNNDGNDDIVTVDMLPPDNKRWKLTIAGNRYDEFNNSVNMGYAPQYVRNTLQLNNGDGTFSEIAQASGINATEWSWAPLFADFDNDGWKDLFVANGYKTDITNLDFMVYGKRALFMGTPEANRRERLKILQKYPGIYVNNYVFRNNHDLTFSNVSNDWGLGKPSYSNGAAYGDLDNDGDLDLVVSNIDEPAAVYENQTDKLNPAAKGMAIKFKGPPGNRDGLETKVSLWQNGMMQYGYCAPVRGYLSSVPAMVYFGLVDKPIDSIKVLWPDGKTQLVSNLPFNKMLVLDYKNAVSAATRFGDIIKPSLLSKVDSSLQINYLHKEDDYIDFKAQPILQHTCSHEGPGLAAGDINGDGLDDFFVGAAAGFDGAVFIQQKDGKFLQQPLPHDNHADDMGALFFDADKDGDLDLYIVSGGTTAEKNGNAIYQDRLYMNDGKGKFSLSVNALPAMNISGASVVAADYDKDGDLDLFVCGRVSPGEYPISPKSILLRNDVVSPSPSGQGRGEVKFTDVSATQLPQQGNMGMVTAALWTDFDNDGWIDLLVAGEFMPITFIKNEKGKLTNNSPLTINNSQGWWNSLVAGDFDNDGDIDFIAGNTGLNNWLKASVAEPVCVYAKDYDKNGRLDPILCHYSEGVEYIVHSRDDINLQMTAMKARFRDYTTWAEVSFKNAFLKEEIADALVLKCQTFSSAYIENKGAGKFEIRALPVEAQLSPIYGMLCTDIDNDGNLDVVCAGNSYAPEVQTGRNDAQGMLILKGNGKGSFVADRTECNTASDNKAISSIQSVDGSRLLLVSSNSGSLKTYRVNQQTKQISLTDADVYAIITNKNSKTYKEEFQFGNSYLSQSSRRLNVAAGTKSLIIYDNKGNKREIKL